MQAIAIRKRLQPTETRIGIVMIALLILLAVGALVTADRAEAPPAAVESPVNTPLDTLADRLASFERIHLLEINTLPEAPRVTLPSLAEPHAVSWYRLPRTLPIRPLTPEQRRLIEMNLLPGDAVPLVPPFGDRLSERY